MLKAPIRYSPDIEQPEPDEAETQRGLIEQFTKIIDTTHADYGHAFRSVHAKSHAILQAELEVLPNLPPELAQGLFAAPRTYEAILRLSTNPGDPLPDTISVPRGMAIKVLGVEGERLPGNAESRSQDFVLANGEAFAAATPKQFLANLKMLAATTDRAEGGKVAISAVLRGTNKLLEAVGVDSPMVKTMGGYPHSHPLGERYFSQVPLRWGDYVAKVGVVPLSDNLKALEGQEIDIDGREYALREEINRVLAFEPGSFELRVQLRRDADANPIEDASTPWPEAENPYIAVAVIRVPRQATWTDERARLVDAEASFSPWHGIAAHQPLGGVMRARRPAYEASAGHRGTLNGCPVHELRSADLPG